jgi:hypothetical protein
MVGSTSAPPSMQRTKRPAKPCAWPRLAELLAHRQRHGRRRPALVVGGKDLNGRTMQRTQGREAKALATRSAPTTLSPVTTGQVAACVVVRTNATITTPAITPPAYALMQRSMCTSMRRPRVCRRLGRRAPPTRWWRSKAVTSLRQGRSARPTRRQRPTASRPASRARTACRSPGARRPSFNSRSVSVCVLISGTFRSSAGRHQGR